MVSNVHKVVTGRCRGVDVARMTMLAALFVLVLAPAGTFAQGRRPERSGPHNDAATRQYWTADRMRTATPMPVAGRRAAGPGTSPTSSENGSPRGPFGFAPGWDPESGSPQPSPNASFQSTSAQPQTSPPFSPPANPTDFGNYSPFQRWTKDGKYTSYPTSTIGKLFFSQDHDGNGSVSNFVCSASVIEKNTIATAGHCLNNGLNGGGANGGWSTNVLFCPSYNAGGVNPARGCWSAVLLAASGWWFGSQAFDRDYACGVTAAAGTVWNAALGTVTGWTGRAWNWPTRQAEIAYGYPAGAPFPGNQIIQTSSTEWYDVNMFNGDGQVSKYIGNDMTGGSSGGPWWLNQRHASVEYADTDGSSLTDPGQGSCCPWINGVNSHKRCNATGCPPPSIFTQEMGSPPFMSTVADVDESEDVFNVCFTNGGT